MIKRFLFFLMLFFLCVTVVGAQDIRFVQVADLNYSSDNSESEKVLNEILKNINKEKNINFVVFSGDNISKANPAILESLIKQLKSLKCPYYLVLGDKDVFKVNKLSKEEYYKIIKSVDGSYSQKSPNYTFTKNGYRFIIANGAKEFIPGTTGYYRQETLNEIKNILKKEKKRKVVLLQHFPLAYPPVPEYKIKAYETYKRDEYLSMLKNYPNVISIISGHFNTNWEGYANGMYNISTPSAKASPHYYKIIDITKSRGGEPVVFTVLKECPIE
ncbi:MAG: metallophosphoesterase [bacterium]|nr:metallophosphoesterase [bacterium]